MHHAGHPSESCEIVEFSNLASLDFIIKQAPSFILCCFLLYEVKIGLFSIMSAQEVVYILFIISVNFKTVYHICQKSSFEVGLMHHLG